MIAATMVADLPAAAAGSSGFLLFWGLGGFNEVSALVSAGAATGGSGFTGGFTSLTGTGAGRGAVFGWSCCGGFFWSSLIIA